MEALFTSLDGGDAIRQAIVQQIQDGAELARSEQIDIHIMTFAFTDSTIAEALADAAVHRPNLRIRLLADWSQRVRVRGQQVGRLADLALSNFEIRYSMDQPYVWDAAANHMRWSYHASHGLLHHRTLCILVNGRPWRLICGSSNWTKAASKNYDNVLLICDDNLASLRLMARLELEFEALWQDGRASLSVDEAKVHYESIQQQYLRDPTLPVTEITGLDHGAGTRINPLSEEFWFRARASHEQPLTGAVPEPDTPDLMIAFSGGRFDVHSIQAGYARPNRDQRFVIRTPAGKTRLAPLTIASLALDTIFRAAPGDTLNVAMYGMSVRVPEYGALLAAARRGVHVFVLLDRSTSSDVVSRLNAVAHYETLPIQIRSCGKMMHQKYVVHREANTVVTGTANMSTDASLRHAEHRIRIRGCPKITGRFCADFGQIWARVAESE